MHPKRAPESFQDQKCTQRSQRMVPGERSKPKERPREPPSKRSIKSAGNAERLDQLFPTTNPSNHPTTNIQPTNLQTTT